MTGYDSKRQMAADKLQEPEREVLKLALEALEICYDVDSYPADGSTVQDKAIAAIKKALAQPPLPVQEQRQPLPPSSPCPMTEAEYKLFKLGWLECEAAHNIGAKP